MVSDIANGGQLYGLPLKTHFSDIFNNWVNKEWIDGDNGISEVTAIDVTDGKLTMDALNKYRNCKRRQRYNNSKKYIRSQRYYYNVV